MARPTEEELKDTFITNMIHECDKEQLDYDSGMIKTLIIRAQKEDWPEKYLTCLFRISGVYSRLRGEIEDYLEGRTLCQRNTTQQTTTLDVTADPPKSNVFGGGLKIT